MTLCKSEVTFSVRPAHACQLLRLGESSNFQALALESEIIDPHASQH